MRTTARTGLRPVAAALLAAGAVVVAACGSPSSTGASGATGSPGPASPTPSVVVTTPTPVPTTAVASPRPKPSPSRTRSPSPRPSTTRPVVPVGGAYVTQVTVPHGCLTVSPAITGVKVYLVQRALGLVGHKERYDAATAAAVRAFQSAHSLPVTGVVDATTWAALGTGYPFCIDRYTQQPAVPATASASARVEAMIAYATSRVGLPYMWGGAGPLGFDCSGLVIQAMYRGGRVVRGLNTDLHVAADFRSTQFIYSSALMHVPFSARRRGDLVFFGSPISHMAIYLGNGRIVEAVRPAIRVASLYADGLSVRAYVVRPFPS